MKKAIKFVEIGWIFVAVASLYQIITLWGTGGEQLFLFTLPVAIAMFFMRRWQRRKMEKRALEREQQHQQEQDKVDS